MTRFIEFLIAVLLVVVLFVLVGVFLPSHRHVEHSVETNHPIRQVYDVLNGFSRFKDWNNLVAHDPALSLTMSGPREGEGSQLTYSSNDNRLGSGTWTISRSDEDAAIRIDVADDAYGVSKTYQIDLEEKIGSGSVSVVNITMGYDVDYGWNLFGRYAGLYVSRTVGDDIEAGLGRLVDMLTTLPNFDYSYLDLAEVEVQPHNVLFLDTKSKRVITEVNAVLFQTAQQLRKAAEDNRLAIAGPLRLVTINYGDTEYKFSVELPVKARSADADSSDEDADEAVASSMDDESTVAMVEPLPGLRLNGGVAQRVSYGGPAVRANVTGDSPARLQIVRESLRSYVMAHGLTSNGYPFEDYLQPVEESIPFAADYVVYWPVEPSGNDQQ